MVNRIACRAFQAYDFVASVHIVLSQMVEHIVLQQIGGLGCVGICSFKQFMRLILFGSDAVYVSARFSAQGHANDCYTRLVPAKAILRQDKVKIFTKLNKKIRFP